MFRNKSRIFLTVKVHRTYRFVYFFSFFFVLPFFDKHPASFVTWTIHKFQEIALFNISARTDTLQKMFLSFHLKNAEKNEQRVLLVYTWKINVILIL